MHQTVALNHIAAYAVDTKRMAMLVYGQPGNYALVLYDRHAVKTHDSSAAIVGYIHFQDTDRCSDNVYEVIMVAAKAGMGPAMHDAALSIAKRDGMLGVVPDRYHNTSSSHAVWRYYFDRRTDVTKTPITDNTNSCISPGNPPHMDHIYSLAAPMSWLSAVERNHRVTARILPQRGVFYDAGELESWLLEEGEGMFRGMWDRDS